jgi:hypothetical protein
MIHIYSEFCHNKYLRWGFPILPSVIDDMKRLGIYDDMKKNGLI